MTELNKTPLNQVHRALGARMVAFAGFDMPVSYGGIIEEHNAVRERVGLFDVCHMGEFFVTGPGALNFVDRVVTNDCTKLADGGILYTVMCRDDGTVVDDLLVARLAEDRVMLVVNAANLDKDWRHIAAQQSGDILLENRSAELALVAVQGPSARDLLKSCPSFAGAAAQLDAVGYYRHFSFAAAGGAEGLVSRTGYTGELGFEVLTPANMAESMWQELMSHGERFGVTPIGLAARDTLRFEASFCLYGHELDDQTTPLEAGLRWVVKLKKSEFIGRAALLAEKERGSKKRLVGLELQGRNIARQGFPVMLGDEVVGQVTSGTFSPTLEKSLCMAYVDSDRFDAGGGYAVQIRQRTVAAVLTELPFYPSRAR